MIIEYKCRTNICRFKILSVMDIFSFEGSDRLWMRITSINNNVTFNAICLNDSKLEEFGPDIEVVLRKVRLIVEE